MYFTIFLILAILGLGSQLFLFLGSLFYYHIRFPLFIKPSYEKNEEFPSTHLIVPCKSASERLNAILNAFAQQDYPAQYRVTFALESERDSAYPIARRIAEQYDHVFVVTAGLATSCSQKNHNMLAALATDSESEVLAFGDADILVGPSWLKGLVHPLTLGKNVVSTGLPSSTIADTTLPHMLQTSLTSYQAKFVLSGGATWGGSTAIWRSTFEQLQIVEIWKKTAVDDITLYGQIQRHNFKHLFDWKNRIRVIPVPDLDFEARTGLNTLSAVIRWLTRQVIYLKFYRKGTWHLAVWGNFLNFVLIVVTPFFLLLSDPEMIKIGYLGISYTMFLFLINMSLPLIRKKDDISFIYWLKSSAVIGDIIANIALLKTLPMTEFTWAQITYKIRPDGTVEQVIHPSSQDEKIEEEPSLSPPLPEESPSE